MKLRETANDFYNRHGQDYDAAGAQFDVARIEDFCVPAPLPANRRDFYKIALVTQGEGTLTYADKAITIKAPALTFTNPMIPYAWEPSSPSQSGYFCLFSEDFVNANLKADSLARSPLYRVGGDHILIPDERTVINLSGIFEQMLIEVQSNYPNKYELLRSYVQIVMHEALRLEPATGYKNQGTSAERITSLFLDLLERQFPVDLPCHSLKLKNAGQFASQLSVHTNHLNRAVKEVTGKTTSELIAGRLAKEAKELLQHSKLDIAEIGYRLGFEHAPNFNIFFKKQTGQSPNHFRHQLVVIA